MTQTIRHLFETPDYRPVVSTWIYEAFWFDQAGYSPEYFEDRLRQADDPDNIPLSLLALEDGRPAGTVSLIVNDDPQRPHLTPWLAALYVDPPFRGHGLATELSRRLLQEATRLNCPAVYLETHIPDFYKRLGAKIHEEIADDFWVMRIPLVAH